MRTKKKTEPEADVPSAEKIIHELRAKLHNPNLPSLGRVLERRGRTISDYLLEKNITSQEKAIVFLEELVGDRSKLQYSYDIDFFEALELLPAISEPNKKTDKVKNVDSTDDEQSVQTMELTEENSMSIAEHALSSSLSSSLPAKIVTAKKA
jgi:hypothetical protein